MCGDGTNDVGALKQAHIGVALLNGSEDDLRKIGEHYRMTKFKEMYEKQVAITKRFNQPAPPPPLAIAHLFPPGPANPNYEKAMEQQALSKGTTKEALISRVEQKAKSQKSKEIDTITTPGAAATLKHNATVKQSAGDQAKANKSAALADSLMTQMMAMEDDADPPSIKLGDASVAAPFTSKLANVIAIAHIIRQGRCALVATIQMYKILALNCLISAYSLSVLYLDGIKFGDGQVTISGILMSVCFLSLSRAKVGQILS